MLGWLRKNKKNAGWLAFSFEAQGLAFAHGRHAAPKSQIGVYGTRELREDRQDLAKVGSALDVARYDCIALLHPGDYQLLLVEAPSVPKEELKSAIRWHIKDMIDYHVDDATVDVLDIPKANTGARAHPMYAVSARNDLIQATIRECEEAKLPLSVIDIPETAQRNIGALYETDEGAVGVVYFADAWGLLTITHRQELYLARRFDIGLNQITGEGPLVEGALEQVAVQIQRTLDHFDRQFGSVALARLRIAPTPTRVAVAGFLDTRLGIDTQDMDLAEVLRFDGSPPPRETQWRLFHHFGAALRHETKAL